MRPFRSLQLESHPAPASPLPQERERSHGHAQTESKSALAPSPLYYTLGKANRSSSYTRFHSSTISSIIEVIFDRFIAQSAPSITRLGAPFTPYEPYVPPCPSSKDRAVRSSAPSPSTISLRIPHGLPTPPPRPPCIRVWRGTRRKLAAYRMAAARMHQSRPWDHRS